MSTLALILVSGLAMSLIALVGSISLLVPERSLQRALLPMVAFAAGSMIGGALFSLLPTAVHEMHGSLEPFVWTAFGFALFLLLEQGLHWHHHQGRTEAHGRPLVPMILIADAIHNFIDGLAVGATFLVSVPLGITTWLIMALHEVPQELGDFAVLVHGGLSRRKALLYNFLTALTFPVGGLMAYLLWSEEPALFLVPFAAGNFLYIGASGLIPEVNRDVALPKALTHFLLFSLGMLLVLALRLSFPHSH